MSSSDLIASFQSARHDHDRCRRDALRVALQVCEQRDARLTPLRRRVLELIWDSHRPVLAYELLEAMQAESGRTAPPTVYRALEFLIAQGLVHRIESLNAFVGCGRPDDSHSGQFLICTDCRAVAELNDGEIGELIRSKAISAGFEVAAQTIEITGTCPDCRPQDS